MDANFGLGLLLAIPIGLLTNLLTAPLQNRLATRSETAKARRTEEARKERLQVEYFQQNVPAYMSFLHRSLCRLLICVLVVMASIVATVSLQDGPLQGLAYLGGNLFEPDNDLFGSIWFYVVFLLPVIAATAGVVAFSNEVGRSGRIARSVQGPHPSQSDDQR